MKLFTRREREREQRDELLSAYLDGELSAEERVRMEAQLATDTPLRVELDALRRTVALVRDLPLVPIPRNFILPQTVSARPRPAQVRPRRAWAAPFLTAATAVVSLLFVVVLAGDLLLSGMGGLASAPAPERLMVAEAPQEAPAPAPVSEEVTVEAEAEVEVEAEKAILADTPLPMPMEAPPQAMPAATVEAEHYAMETLEGIQAPAPAPTASPPGAERADQVPTMPAGGGGPSEESNALTPTVSLATAEEVEKVSEALITPATATMETEMDMGTAESTPGEGVEVVPLRAGEEEARPAEGEWGEPGIEAEGTEFTTILPWRALEVILGLTTLGLALTTIRAWRARHR